MHNHSYCSLKQSKKIGDYQIRKTIGCGTFGKVKEGIHLPTAQKVAIKILQKSKIKNPADLIRIKHELQILMKVNHPNIIKLLQFHETDKNLYIITELIQGKQLFQFIVESERINEDLCGIYLTQVINAVMYLHSVNICHRDIKPENIIVAKFESGSQNKDDLSLHQLKLIDFGLSKQFGSDQLLSTACGSPCYAAPEMLEIDKKHKYNAIKTDIWAIGITLHAMALGRLPFQDDNTDRLYKIIHKGQLKFSNQQMKLIPKNIRDMIKNMLMVNPQNRLPLQKLMDQHKNWFSKYQQILAKYDEFVKSQNNELILDSMSKFFNLPPTRISEIIQTKQIQSISAYYYLCSRKNLHIAIEELYKPEKSDDIFEQHDAPFHINFVFDTIDQILEFLSEKNCEDGNQANGETIKLINKSTVEYHKTIIKIKKLVGTEMLYIDVPSYFTMQT